MLPLVTSNKAMYHRILMVTLHGVGVKRVILKWSSQVVLSFTQCHCSSLLAKIDIAPNSSIEATMIVLS